MNDTLLLQLARGPRQHPGTNGHGDKPLPRTTVISLIADQLLHPDRTGDYFIRHGRLRVSELLPDGRELTRAVLHEGTAFTVLAAGFQDADPLEDFYHLERMIVMALGETEIWSLSHPTTAPGRRSR